MCPIPSERPTGTECDAGPLFRSGHVHDYENHEHGEQSARKDKHVHALQSLELRTAADSLVDRILRHITGRMSVRWSLPQSGKYTPRTSWPPSSRCRGPRTRILNRPCPSDQADHGPDCINQFGCGIEIGSDHVGRLDDTADSITLGESPCCRKQHGRRKNDSLFHCRKL